MKNIYPCLLIKVTFRVSDGNFNLPTYLCDSSDSIDSCDISDISDSSDSSVSSERSDSRERSDSSDKQIVMNQFLW